MYRSSYLSHLRLVRNMILPNYSRAQFNPNIQPDNCVPNNYCCSCDKSLASIYSYQQHLEHLHGVSTPSMNLSLLPDVNDINFYFRVCKINYRKREDYLKHLKHVNKINLPPLLGMPIYDPNILKNTSCEYCNMIFKSRPAIFFI
jgi:hypothetical protein